MVRQIWKNNSANPSKSVHSNGVDQNENHKKRVILLLVQKLKEPFIYEKRRPNLSIQGMTDLLALFK